LAGSRAPRESMKRDEVFQGKELRGGDFEFNADVAQVFDDMLPRSIPMYAEQQEMAKNIGRKFHVPGTDLYDLGCSTATTLINLAGEIPEPARFIGYDYSEPMLEEARRKARAEGLGDRIELRHGDLNGQLADLPLENASVVYLCWTLQFIRPLQRDKLISWIYEGLVDGGVLVCMEKVLTNNNNMNRFFIQLYYDFKRGTGYSEEEIARKREALENVLVPYRIDENTELFQRNGFRMVETFFQWYNFVGFLCVKKG